MEATKEKIYDVAPEPVIGKIKEIILSSTEDECVEILQMLKEMGY